MKINRKMKLMVHDRPAVTLEGTATIGHRRRCPAVHLEPAIFLGNEVELESPFVGMGTQIGDHTRIKVTQFIGRFTSIGSDCLIGAKSLPPAGRVGSSTLFQDNTLPWCRDFLAIQSPYSYPKRTRIRIGNDVWIGDRVTLLENVLVGDGAIVETGSTVTEDVPPYAIVQGNPARIIGYRFEESVRKALESAAWWNYGIDLFRGLDLPTVSETALLAHLQQVRGQNKPHPLSKEGILLKTEEKYSSIYSVADGETRLLYRVNLNYGL